MDVPVTEEIQIFKTRPLYSLGMSQARKLITLIPSFLAMNAPLNEEIQIFNLLENEQNSPSDHGLSLGILKIKGSWIRKFMSQAR